MDRTRLVAFVLTLVVSIPVAVAGVASIRRTVGELRDPCAKWGVTEMAATIGPQDPCREVTAHAETRTAATVIAAIVPGGMLGLSVLAFAGVALSSRRAAFASAMGMLAETVPAFSVAPLTLLAALTFLLVSRRLLERGTTGA